MLACHLEYNPIVAYRAYEEIAGLSPDMLRHLLHHGDAVERVWAAWAIGAALGAQSAADLLVSLRESPVAGTRRHLLVVLAGLGEQSVLRVFAQDDPDEYVRATACRYLIRIDGHANAFIRERLLQDPSPNVRLTILDEAPAAYPSVQFDELSLLVRDTQLEVRQAATERLLATSPLMELFPGALEDRIPSEDDTALRQRLLAECLRAGGSRRLLALTMSLAPDRSREILGLLMDKEERFSWEQLGPLTTQHQPRLDSLLIQLLKPESTVSALTWLLRAIAHAATWPAPGNREEREIARAVRLSAWQATQLLLASHAQLQAIDRLDFDRSSMQLVITHLGKEIVELESEREYDEEEPASYDEAINQRHALINTLSRMALVD